MAGRPEAAVNAGAAHGREMACEDEDARHGSQRTDRTVFLTWTKG